MSTKGFPTQKKLNTPLVGVTDKFTKDQYGTFQPNYSDKVGQDVVSGGYFRLTAVKTVTAASTSYPKRTFTCTSHGGSIGDVVRFEITAANPGFEGVILDVPNANTIVLGAETPNNITNTDTFFILRSVSARLDDTGATISVTTSGPIQFVLNGTDTEVEQDTGTPANSIPLPTILLDAGGNRVDPDTFSTLAEQQTQTTALGAIQTAVQIMDDWDESDRAKVNPIVGQAGVQGGSGAVSANTQRVVLATDVALPTGSNIIGALSANQTVNLNQVAGTAVSVNSGATDAGTQRVVLSATQPTISVSSTGVYNDVTSSGTITTQNLAPTSTATAGSAVETSGNGTNNRRSAIVTVTGVYTGALSLQTSSDGTTWRTISNATNFYDLSAGTYSATIASAATGDFQISIGGQAYVRVTALAAVTGTATVSIRVAIGGNSVVVQAPLPTGSNIIGALSANQSVNVAQMNGTTVTMGAGVTGTGVQRVIQANQSSATVASVNDTASSTTLLASAAARMGASFFNDSTENLYLKYGATATTSDYSVRIAPGGYFELPQPCYSGVIDGIWSANASGAVKVTSW